MLPQSGGMEIKMKKSTLFAKLPDYVATPDGMAIDKDGNDDDDIKRTEKIIEDIIADNTKNPHFGDCDDHQYGQ